MHLEEFQRYNCRRYFAWLSFAVIGFIFGCGFIVAELMVSGGGHGSYVPIAIFSSPLGLLDLHVVLFGVPILWSAVGVFSYEMLESGNKRGPFLILMGLHFGCLPWLLACDEFGNWDLFWRTYQTLPMEMIAGFIFYGVAQILAWNCFVVACVKRPPRFGVRTLFVVTFVFAIWLSFAAAEVRNIFSEITPDQSPKVKIVEEPVEQLEEIE